MSGNATGAGTPTEAASSPAAATTSPAAATTAAAASTTAAAAPTSDAASSVVASPSSSSVAQPTTSAAPTSSTTTSTTSSTTSTSTTPSSTSTTSETPSTSSAALTTSAEATTSAAASTSANPASTSSPDLSTSVVTVTPSDGTSAQTSVVLVTATSTQGNAASETVSSSGTSTATPIDPSGSSGGGLSQKSKVAIGVVVPIAAIAILALVGLFWWKKRRARQEAAEERRKEVEDYSYNPNADPTIPNVMGGDGSYEMREDGSAGYRGWGNTTTVAGSSTGRKASTTMSGGVTGQAYSDAASPTRANMSDAPLMDGSQSPEGEILGVMGPSTANNRGADVHRGPSNASSSYSAAARSDNSDGAGVPYGAGGTYYDQYAQNNPYTDNGFQQSSSGQPVIRDNPARRNTRIENPSHYPQQSAGISQNF